MIRKFFLSHEEIKADLELAKKLKEEGKLNDEVIPEYWCKGTSPHKKNIVILLSIFLGFLGIDRFYLGKWLSGSIKFLITAVVTCVFIYGLVAGWHLIKNSNGSTSLNWEILSYTILWFVGAISFYLTDIVLAFKRTRDSKYRCVTK